MLLICSNIALDKTGTLTSGKLTLKDIHFYPNIENQLKRREKVIHLASLLSKGSKHPIALAILDISSKLNFSKNNFKINNYKHIPGSGIEADLLLQGNGENKKKIALGSSLFIKSLFNTSTTTMSKKLKSN